MIFGIGSDIAHIPRFERLFARHGDKIVATILTPAEHAEFTQRHARNSLRGMAFFASRFAAKEAFSKACGLGITAPMHWHNVQISHLPSGQPYLQTLGDMAAWCNERALKSHLTLSDEREYAIAYVVLESTL
jgi:holo-[acyl-carrier protein] synthase